MIYERFFEGRAMLPGKTFDDPHSIQFRKQLAVNNWLAQTKPSSIPGAREIERTGTRMTHHVLWLRDEGSALRESQTYRSPTRAPRRSLFADNAIKGYLNRVHSVIGRLKSL